jgi:hypothetical protein
MATPTATNAPAMMMMLVGWLMGLIRSSAPGVHGVPGTHARCRRDNPAVRCKRFRQLGLMRSCINVFGF